MRVPCNCFATEFNMNPACFCMPHESASQAREDAKVGCAMGSCSWRRAGPVTKLDAHWNNDTGFDAHLAEALGEEEMSDH